MHKCASNKHSIAEQNKVLLWHVFKNMVCVQKRHITTIWYSFSKWHLLYKHVHFVIIVCLVALHR